MLLTDVKCLHDFFLRTLTSVLPPPPRHFSDSTSLTWPLCSSSKSNPPLPSKRVSNYQRCSGESTSLCQLSHLPIEIFYRFHAREE